MNPDDILNALLAAFLPVINNELPSAIKAAGLDPWATVAKDDESLGKINLGICTAKAKASYSIKNMKGLSSLEILSCALDSASTIVSGSDASGKLTMKAKLTSNLSAKVEGKVSASCSFVSESVKISGKITAKGVTGTCKGSYTATIGAPNACLTKLNIDSLSLHYSDIDVDIDGLGIFNDFLKPLEDAVMDLFKGLIEDEIAAAVKPPLNKLIKGEIPFCIAVPQTA